MQFLNLTRTYTSTGFKYLNILPALMCCANQVMLCTANLLVWVGNAKLVAYRCKTCIASQVLSIMNPSRACGWALAGRVAPLTLQVFFNPLCLDLLLPSIQL